MRVIILRASQGLRRVELKSNVTLQNKPPIPHSHRFPLIPTHSFLFPPHPFPTIPTPSYPFPPIPPIPSYPIFYHLIPYPPILPYNLSSNPFQPHPIQSRSIHLQFHLTQGGPGSSLLRFRTWLLLCRLQSSLQR